MNRTFFGYDESPRDSIACAVEYRILPNGVIEIVRVAYVELEKGLEKPPKGPLASP